MQIRLSWSMIVILIVGALSAMAARPPVLPLSASSFTVTVQDQNGVPTANASIIVRDGESYRVVANPTTNADGNAVMDLESSRWYVVLVYYTDCYAGGTQENPVGDCSRETWWYGYILPADWSPAPRKVMRRNNPWIGTVNLPSPVQVGEPQRVELLIEHGLTTTNYDLKVRAAMWVDDDGQAPYLYETMSGVQSFLDGIAPFYLDYTPANAGHYVVRFRVDRQFEQNEWEVSDEGGWNWSVDVGQPTETPTPTPTITSTVMATATPTELPTVTPYPTPSITPTPEHCVVQGTVYEDFARNDIRDDNDLPVPGMQVLLDEALGTHVASQVTQADGRYRFVLSSPGNYQVYLGETPGSYGHRRWVYYVAYVPGETWSDRDFALWRWYCSLPLFVR